MDRTQMICHAFSGCIFVVTENGLRKYILWHRIRFGLLRNAFEQ